MIKVSKEMVESKELDCLEQQMQYLVEVKDEIERLKMQLADGYLSIIEVRGEFDIIKKENLKEIRQFKDDCFNEINSISEIFHALSKAINGVGIDNLRKSVDLFKQLSELSNNGFCLKLNKNEQRDVSILDTYI